MCKTENEISCLLRVMEILEKLVKLETQLLKTAQRKAIDLGKISQTEDSTVVRSQHTEQDILEKLAKLKDQLPLDYTEKRKSWRS